MDQNCDTRRYAWFSWLLPLVILFGIAWYSRPQPLLRVIFLNTPGDAVLIQAPDRSFTLIDGGRDPALLALQLGRQLPFYERKLRAVVLTDTNSTHLPGQVAALSRYHADLALAPPALDAYGTAGEWLRLLDRQAIPVRIARPGTRLNLGGGVRLAVLAVAAGEQGGMLLQLAYGTTRVTLHMGGPDLDEAALQAAGAPTTLLAYPWQREPDEALLARLRPQAILFSDGYTIDEPALLSYADRAFGDAAVYHERNEGEVTLLSDGRRAWIETDAP